MNYIIVFNKFHRFLWHGKTFCTPCTYTEGSQLLQEPVVDGIATRSMVFVFLELI